MSLAGALLSGDVRALARAISLAEDRDPQAIHLLDAYGRDVILVETVGVGQSELEISTICDTVVLVLMPESGDAVQSIKAGILEIADVFVINKADLGGAEKTRRLIQDAIGLGPKQAWRAPIVLASAAREEGIAQVWDAVRAHQAYLTESGTLATRRQQRLKQEVMALVADRAREDARRMLDGDTAVGRRVRENQNGKLNPYALAEEVLDQRAAQGGS